MSDDQSKTTDAPRLSDRERVLFLAMAAHTHDLGWGFGFKSLAAISGLPAATIRRTVRALARKGLAEFERSLWTEDGVPAGAGYALTQMGRTIGNAKLETEAA
jgi:hypothetical protein